MPDPTPDNQEGRPQDHGQAQRADLPVNGKLLGQMFLLTALVLGVLVFLIYGVVTAIPQRNTPELSVGIPTLLLTLWVMYKIIKGWANWRSWPQQDPRSRG